MKKFALVLFVLLAVETWGVVGRAQADRIVYDCVVEAGPLCFYWEQSALAKALPEGVAEKFEDKLEDARDAWEKNVTKMFDEKDGVDKALEKANEALEKAKRAFD